MTKHIVGYDYGVRGHGLVLYICDSVGGRVRGVASRHDVPLLGSIKDVKSYDDIAKYGDKLIDTIAFLNPDMVAIDADVYEIFWGKRKDTLIKGFIMGQLVGRLGRSFVMFLPPKEVRRFWGFDRKLKKQELQVFARSILESGPLLNQEILDTFSIHEMDAMILAYIAAEKLLGD